MANSEKAKNFRGRVYENIVETIGATPLVKVSRLAESMDCKADILCKCEFFNPLASVKDRIGIAMIEAAEEAGDLSPGATVIEPTSGNTGMALAFVCASKGYRLVLTVPEGVDEGHRKMLSLLGAEIIRTPAEQGMSGAIAKANELLQEIEGSFMPQQFSNPANPKAHEDTTAEEIWTDTGGKVDVIVAGVGTGGTLTGIARALKPRNPELKAIAVEPLDSSVLAGGMPGPHKIPGIGAGFIPDNIDMDLVDEVIAVGNHASFYAARRAAEMEGIPAGVSAGAALSAALDYGTRDGMEGKTIVVILPSMAERYLTSELFEIYTTG